MFIRSMIVSFAMYSFFVVYADNSCVSGTIRETSNGGECLMGELDIYCPNGSPCEAEWRAIDIINTIPRCGGYRTPPPDPIQ